MKNTADTLRPGLTAAMLRCLALFFMLLDHIWFVLAQPGAFWLTCLGRLAMPIFAFQIAEGYFHTSNFRRYALRLLLFALISEVPFNLMVSGSVFYPPKQNVMFTLLFGLLTLKVADWSVQRRMAHKLLGVLAALCLYAAGDLTGTDYGSMGVLMVLLFGLAGRMRRGEGATFDVIRKYRLHLAVQLVGLAIINYHIGGRMLQVGSVQLPNQNLAILSLILIWLYDGRKGTSNKIIQYGAYLFYPVHIILLVLLRQVLWG